MLLPMPEKPYGEEPAHTGRICGGGRSVKPTFTVPVDNQKPVDVPAVVQERSGVIASGVKDQPTTHAEVRNAFHVAEKSYGLLSIHPWKLVLVSATVQNLPGTKARRNSGNCQMLAGSPR